MLDSVEFALTKEEIALREKNIDVVFQMFFEEKYLKRIFKENQKFITIENFVINFDHFNYSMRQTTS